MYRIGFAATFGTSKNVIKTYADLKTFGGKFKSGNIILPINGYKKFNCINGSKTTYFAS